MSFIQELKRRNVFRVAIAYVIIAWLVMQVGDTMVPALHLPVWAASLLAFFLILGFPIAMFFAWAFELTSEGVKRDQNDGAVETNQAHASRKLDRIIMLVMVLALGYFVLDKFVFSPAGPQLPNAEPVSVAVTESPTVAEINNKSIVVLPFVNMSSDPEQEYFSDGLTEELLNLLAGIDELKVAARTSSFFYKDKVDTIPLTVIARELEVAHVLEGSVRKSGDRIRITAQLIKAADGFHLWSQTYDRELTDIFAIQDEIAAAVTESLRITLLGDAPHARILNTESYELALEARFLFNRRNEGDLQLAFEKFERATQLDGNNAAAWLGVAPLYRWLFDPPDITRSLQAVQRAVDLAPDNAEAHMRLFVALTMAGEEGAHVDKEWDLAKKLGQQNALIQVFIAGREWDQGNYEKSVEIQLSAIALEPLTITYRGNLAIGLIRLGRYEEAIYQVTKISELAPMSSSGFRILAIIDLLQGEPEKALQSIQQMTEGITPSGSGDHKLQLQAMVYYSLGRVDEADRALALFLDKYSDFNYIDIVEIYAWRNDPDNAFLWLNNAPEPEPRLLDKIQMEPFLKGLHNDPRWDQLLEKWTNQENETD